MKLFLFALGGIAWAQTLPAELVLLSASYSNHPGAKFAGTFSFATRLATPANCYSYTSWDLGITHIGGKQTFANSTRTGGACQVPQLSGGKFSAFILGTAGVTIVNATALGSGSFGVLGNYRFTSRWFGWGDFQNSNTTGKTARVGGGFAWGK